MSTTMVSIAESVVSKADLDSGKADSMSWTRVCTLEEIPRLGARVVRSTHGDIAVFRTADDEVFALADKCPHKAGPLSQGIVHGKHVTCPLHNWNISLSDGIAVAPDEGCSARFSAKCEAGSVYILV
jgi:nitrite reductase (NADH) small subunit